MLERAFVELITSPDFPDNSAAVEEVLSRIFGQAQRESLTGTMVEDWKGLMTEDPEALDAYKRLTAEKAC